VIGITFGFKDEKDVSCGRRMYAYGIGLVLDEMRRLISADEVVAARTATQIDSNSENMLSTTVRSDCQMVIPAAVEHVAMLRNRGCSGSDLTCFASLRGQS
jgi:hypothetical protein